MWWQAHRPAIPLPEDINANTAGNALAILLPLSIGATACSWRSLRIRRAERSAVVPASALALTLALTSAVSFAALLLTASRGAWIGLTAGAVAALAAGVIGRRLASRSLAFGATLAVFALLAGGMIAVLASPAIAARLGSVGGGAGGSAIGRGILWRDMLAQVGDYPFTGSGLAATMMVDATYFRLLHVGFIPHAHNLFLQIAIEQGLIGLAAFVGILAAALYGLFRVAGAGRAQGGLIRLFALAGIASLVALCVHSLVDTGVYTAKIAPVIFVPLAFALAVAEAEVKVEVEGETRTKSGSALALALTLTLALVFALLRPVRAQFQAQLGAVSQTRAELSVYRWPEWPIQDALRRPLAGAANAADPVDLGPAIARYRAALALDPANVTANRRLGQIELSRGDYEAARRHLAAAYGAAPDQQVTRQLLGESYALAGDAAGAAALWRTVALGQGQLSAREWWYGAIGETANQQRITQAIEQLGAKP